MNPNVLTYFLSTEALKQNNNEIFVPGTVLSFFEYTSRLGIIINRKNYVRLHQSADRENEEETEIKKTKIQTRF